MREERPPGMVPFLAGFRVFQVYRVGFRVLGFEVEGLGLQV